MTVNKLDQTYKLTESADYAEQWINCKVFWDEIPMSIISKELERQFDVTFAFESEQLKNLIFHGSFIIETNNLEKILDIMSETNKFSYSIEKDKVYIYSLKNKKRLKNLQNNIMTAQEFLRTICLPKMQA